MLEVLLKILPRNWPNKANEALGAAVPGLVDGADHRLDLVYLQRADQVPQQGAAGLSHVPLALHRRRDQPADPDPLLAHLAAVIVDHADNALARLFLDRPQRVLEGVVGDMPAQHAARLVERRTGIDAPITQV